MIKDIIVKLRHEKQLTQQQMALLLSMSRTGYANWEQGLAEPSSSDIRKLCIIFNIPADELLEIDTKMQRDNFYINNSFNNNKGKIDFKT